MNEAARDATMRPGDVATLIILVIALYFAWRVAKGSSGGVPLYALVISVPLCLFVVALGALLGRGPIVEVFMVAAVAFSLALLPAHPRLWEEELQADLKETRVFQVMHAGDALSWRGWLKLVDRIGAGRTALAFLALEVVAILCALPALLAMSGDIPIGFVLAALFFPGLYAALSSLWFYRAARRLVPGS
jgi:hypothetical protein